MKDSEPKPVNMMQVMSDCGINPFAVLLLWESWARHPVQPRKKISFPFRDAVITLEPIEDHKSEATS